jgi:cysteine-rich repeat protein
VNGDVHQTDGAAEQAQIDLHGAWTTLMNEPCDVTLTNADLAGLTLLPGVYCFDSPAALLTGELTLDAGGVADAVFVFKIASTLTTASGSSVVMTNGANECQIFWQLGSSATLGTNSTFAGTILASASITVMTGATVAGRLLAHTGAVTLDSNSVTLDCEANGGGGADAGTGADATDENGADATIDNGGDAGTAGPDAGPGANTDANVPPLPEPECGNGVLEVGEQCDDGNDDNNDACSNTCIVQT